MLKRFLITPGPTPVPPEVLSALAEPVVHHRAPRFTEILKEVVAGMKYVYQTENDVIVFAASGTGAMESAVVNVVNPGDHVLVASIGNFGERWKKLNATWGAEVTALDYEWGTKAVPADIEKALAADPAIKAVYVQFSETSTGVVNDIKAIGEIVARTPAILVVDAISGLGATDLKTDAWHVDICVAGSQKALMVPPGLAYVAVSEKAWNVDRAVHDAALLLRLRHHAQEDDRRQRADAVHAGRLAHGRAERRHRAHPGRGPAERVRAASRARQGRARGRQGARPRALRRRRPRGQLRDRRQGAGGRRRRQDQQARARQVRRVAGRRPGRVKGQIFRFGHCGYFGDSDILVGLGMLEMVLAELGYDVKWGAAVGAAEQVFMQSTVRSEGVS